MTSLGEAHALTEPPGSLASQYTERIEGLRQELEVRHMAVLSGFLGGYWLEWVLRDVEVAEWEPHHSELKSELVMVENRATALLHFLMNDAALFALIGAILGCASIGRLRGRTYRMYADAGHADNWHDDLASGRVAAISINLSERPFGDGAVEMRDSETKIPIATAPPLELGDAVLLRLRRGLEHRVREVKGAKPKTAFAGFFYAEEPSVLTAPRVATRASSGRAPVGARE